MFVSVRPLQPSLIFVGKTRSLPKRCTFHLLHSRVGSSLTCTHYTKPQRLAVDKRSSLLRKFVNYGRKKFYNIGPWYYAQCQITVIEVFLETSHSCLIFIHEVRDRQQYYKTFFCVTVGDAK